MILRSAYFSDFNGGPTVLLWGDALAMRQLSDLLTKASKVGGTHSLTQISQPIDGNEIKLVVKDARSGLKPTASGFEWGLDAPVLMDFAEMVDVLALSNQPGGHQYLECNLPDEIVVVASRGEYPADLRP